MYPGADPGFQLGGFYLYKRAQSAHENIEATPTFWLYLTVATATEL